MIPLDAKPGDAWSPAARSRIATAFRAGGIGVACRAFPDLSYAAVRSAVRRFATERPSGPPAALRSRDEVLAALRAIPTEVFAERLAALVHRRADYQGTAA